MASAMAPSALETQGSASEAEVSPEVAAELRAAEHGANMAMSNAQQRIIEQKEAELRATILGHYQRIRDVEKELGSLQLQLKITAGPKRQALELMRKKIEIQTDKVKVARQKYMAAKAIADAAQEELKHEEGLKDELCNELNTLVQQSTTLQMNRLEELRQHLELLNRGVSSTAPLGGVPVAPAPAADAGHQLQGPAEGSAPQAAEPPAPAFEGFDPHEAAAASRARAEEEEAEEQRRREAAEEQERLQRQREAEAARGRHVGIKPASARREAGAASGRQQPVQQQRQVASPQQKPQGITNANGRFSGFDT